MKANIHPTWYQDAKVICACGETFITGSTVPVIKVQICSKCHPFFTGKQKFVDTLGQVDRFEKRQKEAAVRKEQIRQIGVQRAQKVQTQKAEKPSLKDLLMQARRQQKSA